MPSQKVFNEKGEFALYVSLFPTVIHFSHAHYSEVLQSAVKTV